MIVLHKQEKRGYTVTKLWSQKLRKESGSDSLLSHRHLSAKWTGCGTKGTLDSSLIDHKYRFFFLLLGLIRIFQQPAVMIQGTKEIGEREDGNK